MNLKIKITLLLTVWLLFILLLCKVVIYYLFIRITTSSELDLLREKAHTILLRDLPHHPEFWRSPGEVDPYVIPREMIRYVTADSKILFQVYKDEELLMQPPHYVTRESTRIVNQDGKFAVYVMTPVYENGRQVATLEIGRGMGQLSTLTDTLFSVLLLTSIGAFILSAAWRLFLYQIAIKTAGSAYFYDSNDRGKRGIPQN